MLIMNEHYCPLCAHRHEPETDEPETTTIMEETETVPVEDESRDEHVEIARIEADEHIEVARIEAETETEIARIEAEAEANTVSEIADAVTETQDAEETKEAEDVEPEELIVSFPDSAGVGEGGVPVEGTTAEPVLVRPPNPETYTASRPKHLAKAPASLASRRLHGRR